MIKEHVKEPEMGKICFPLVEDPSGQQEEASVPVGVAPLSSCYSEVGV